MEQYDKITLSKLRLARTQEFLGAAIDAADSGQYLTSANRAYYAVYTAVRALLILEHNEMTKHMGNISEFRKHYIKTGIFKKEFSGYVGSLFEIRNYSDYDPMFIISKDKVLLEYAKEIVSDIKDYLTALYDRLER